MGRLDPFAEDTFAIETGERRQSTAPRMDLVVRGIPASLQSSAGSRERWKQRVQEAARARIREEDQILGECRGIVVYFYFGETQLDVDNVIKPISDALSGIAYGDDRNVSEWIARKTDLGRTEIVDPPPVLMGELPDRVVAAEPFVYVCVVDEAPNHREMPR